MTCHTSGRPVGAPTTQPVTHGPTVMGNETEEGVCGTTPPERVQRTMREWMMMPISIRCTDDEVFHTSVGSLYGCSSYVRDVMEVHSASEDVVSIVASNVPVGAVEKVVSRLDSASDLWKTEGRTCDEIEASLFWLSADCLRFIDMFDLRVLCDPILYLVNAIPMTTGGVYLVMDEVWPFDTDWAGQLVLEWCLMALMKGTRDEGEDLLDSLSDQLKSDVLHHLFYTSRNCSVVRACLMESPGTFRDASIHSHRTRDTFGGVGSS